MTVWARSHLWKSPAPGTWCWRMRDTCRGFRVQTPSVTNYARSSVVDMVALRKQSSEKTVHKTFPKNEKYESVQEAQS